VIAKYDWRFWSDQTSDVKEICPTELWRIPLRNDEAEEGDVQQVGAVKPGSAFSTPG
jgi:hypothetical protein